MKGFKRILALMLVFAMAFTFSAGAANFTDEADINANYVDDVNMLVELGVLAGYPDGSFGPQKNITRAEFAKMAYTLKYGSDTDGELFAAQTSAFSDVEGNANVAWAKGYINYCANQKIVSGVGNGKFNPQGNITVAEAAKMILVILGCDPALEGFTGASWMSNVVAKAIDLGIFNGWAGDPSALATRELVAKLMKNAIFSPMYTYSSITGEGSQKNALGTADNETLGEKTMGLKTVTGIVVANERYEIERDAVGEEFGVGISATGEDSGKAVIAYERKADDGTTEYTTMTIDRALGDELLGSKVNVFFKADKIESNGRIDYKNIEVIGDVLVHSDTVVFDVPAIAADVYPDGESTSSSQIRPYIGFELDGEEYKIYTSNDVPKFAKNVDVQNNSDVETAFNRFAYILNGHSAKEDGTLENVGEVSGDEFLGDMGNPVLSSYRFVSVDGGKTFSYLFKLFDNENTGYGVITSYNKNAGTIRVSGDTEINGAYDLEDVVLKDEIAVDDAVVAYRANGKLVVEKVEIKNAAVEEFTDEGIVLGGEEYLAWEDCDLEGYESLFDFYQKNKGAMLGSTAYYIHNGLIMEINKDAAEVTSASDYAVILRTMYDATLDVAYVKLGFADNTEGTYKIGKLYERKSSNTQAPASDELSDFYLNANVGLIVQYKILDDGTVDLSAQSFKDKDYLRYYMDGTSRVGYYDADGAYQTVAGVTKSSEISISDGTLSYTREYSRALTEDEARNVAEEHEQANYYGLDDSVLIFALYGKPGYTIDDDTGEIIVDQEISGYAALKSRTFKLSQIRDMESGAVIGLYTHVAGNGDFNSEVGYVLLNSQTSKTKYVVAASMTVGTGTSGIKYNETGNLAYVVSAYQEYSVSSSAYYARLVLVDENGTLNVVTGNSIKDVEDSTILTSGYIGRIDGVDGTLPAGSFVRYSMDSEGKIDVLDIEGSNKSEGDIQNAYNDDQFGFFLVNMADQRGDTFSFYNADQTIAASEATMYSISAHKTRGCKIIAVSEGEYAGETLTKIPARLNELVENEGNAVLQVEEGQVVRIFSFPQGYTLD